MIKRSLLNLLGHQVTRGATIGIIFLGKNTRLLMDKNTYIGSLNYINCKIVKLGHDSFIRHFNMFSGDFDLELESGSSIGNLNRFKNSQMFLEYEVPKFSIGTDSNITSMHYFDMTDSISIGNNSVVGGSYSQFWTHGFRHLDFGNTRVRIDAKISIGSGVYLGSKVILNPGVKITDMVSVGAGAVVGKSLLKDGLYVTQNLRFINASDAEFRKKYDIADHENGAIFVKKK